MTSDDGHLSGVTVRVGLVGAGGVGARHARTLAGFDDVDLVAVCDPVAASAEALAGEVGARRRRTTSAACSPSGWTPSGCACRRSRTASWSCRSCAPGCRSSSRSPWRPTWVWPSTWPRRSLPPACRRRRDTTGGTWTRSSGPARRSAGTPVRLVDARWWSTTPPPAWWSRQDRSGGQVIEQATHLLDLVRLLAGEVAEVVGASAPSSAGGRDVPDAAVAVLRLDPAPSGRSASPASCRR